MKSLFLGLLMILAIVTGGNVKKGNLGNRKDPSRNSRGLAVIEIDNTVVSSSCNRRLEVCCGGIKYNGIFYQDVACCGTQYYYPDNARCCRNNDASNGTIVQLPSRRWNNFHLQCCGTQLYNFTTQICCNNRIQPRDRYTSCCGDRTYNLTEEICCFGRVSSLNNRVLLCCGTTAYDPTQSRCLSNNRTMDIPSNVTIPQVCGDTIIDRVTQLCCQGVARNRGSGLRLCCGTGVYDATTQICCRGTILQDSGDGSRCCGNQLYQPSSQICCRGNVIRRPSGFPISSEDSIFSFSWELEAYQCCGQEIVNDPDTQLCCNFSRLYTFNSSLERWQNSCCRDQAFNFNTQTCCQGRIVDGYNLRCCGNAAYDENSQTCCNNELFVNGQVPRDQCCCNSQLCYAGGD